MSSSKENLLIGQKLENRLVLDWIYRYDIKTEDGIPLDWYNHGYMIDVYDEMAKAERPIVGLKAAQVTWSTAAILCTFHIAKNKNIDIIYCLPTADDVKQFAGGKTNRIIAQNPILQRWVKEKDTVEQKTVGNSIIYYRGSWIQKAAMMVSSDLNIYDEVDASNQGVIEQYSTRLQHSKLKLEWYFSHPSVPGYGVSKYWPKSDQRHWFITCEHCKHQQYIEWPESFDLKSRQYVCKKCKGTISDDIRRTGRWVKKWKDKDMIGFWVPLFICPWISADEIIKYYETKPADYFWNKVLGLPYVGSGNKVTQQMIFQNLTDEVNFQENPVIGVDTGIDIRYVIGNKEGLFYYGECKDYDELENFLIRWPKAVMVIDQGGDIIGPRKLREKYLGRVFLCHYRQDRKTMELIRWGKGDEEEGNILVDRNRMIQLVVDEFTDKRIPINGNETDWNNYWLHWDHIYRVKEEDALGVMRYKWERSGRDDWAHATVYWRVGMDRFGQLSQGAVIGDEILKLPESPEILPNQTMEAPNPKKIFRFQSQDNDWRNR